MSRLAAATRSTRCSLTGVPRVLPHGMARSQPGFGLGHQLARGDILTDTQAQRVRRGRRAGGTPME
jgi:hypothetical protein